MVKCFKRISAGLLTAFTLISFFSFNVSASTVNSSSENPSEASPEVITAFDEETPENPSTPETPDSPKPSSGTYKAPSGATVTYRTRARKKKWEKKYKKQAALSGSIGKKKTLDSIQIKIKTSVPGKLLYRTQSYKRKWGAYKSNGKTSGKKGGKLAQIQIKLTGELAEKYDIYYRVHVRTSNGWMNWAKNGESAGAIHYARFIEAIQIVLTEKGAGEPGNVGGYKSQRSGPLLNANHIKEAMIKKAQNVSSKTKWLILCDTNNFFAAVFNGSKNNWKLVRFIYVGVGKKKTPTKKGTFRVRKKRKKMFGYGTRCKYCTSFKGAYYFHSLPYYWNGKRIYSPVLGKRVSHGCVRMALDDAKYIYKKVPKKSKVWVY